MVVLDECYRTIPKKSYICTDEFYELAINTTKKLLKIKSSPLEINKGW